MNSNHEMALSQGREHIDLCDLLKHAGICESGGAAKHLIAGGEVTVDGGVELRKRCKVRPGQVVEAGGQKVVVVPAPESPAE
jgi:ribosome-associated protein